MDHDRCAVRGRLVRGLPIELVIEDGTDGSVGEGVDVNGACGSGFEPIAAERALQAQDAEAGPEALFGMRPTFQDEFTQRSRRRSEPRTALEIRKRSPTSGAISRRQIHQPRSAQQVRIQNGASCPKSNRG